MRRWEYKVISTRDLPDAGKLFAKAPTREVIEEYLNQLGEQGWEIVNADFLDQIAGDAYFHALAKREKS